MTNGSLAQGQMKTAECQTQILIQPEMIQGVVRNEGSLGSLCAPVIYDDSVRSL